MTSMTNIKRVEKLAVTILVDNSIEWFLNPQPGFINELRNHLQHEPPIDPLTGVPIVDLENYCCGAHGFSAVIETQETENSQPHFTLFDAGPDSRTITRNIASLKIPVERVERVILSHWHADHSGGILAFLRARNEASKAKAVSTPCTVDLHPDRPIARGIAPAGRIIGRIPADPTFEEIEELGGVVEKHENGHAVAGGTVWVSGEVPRVTEYEQGLPGAVRWTQEEGSAFAWTPEEHIMDERYAAVDVVGKGLVVFSACSHAGIINVVKDAIHKFQRPVYMIIGGLHLGTPDLYERIPPTVEFLAKKMRPSPTYVLPMHCSGFEVKVALHAALGDGCIPAGTGVRIEVAGDHAMDARLSTPSVV